MPSRPLLANDSFGKERLSLSSFLIPTHVKSLCPSISKTIAVSLYSFEFGFVTCLYKAFSFERVVKIVSSECDAYPTVSASMIYGHLVKHHEI